MSDARPPVRPLLAEGERVRVASATDGDVEAYIRATERSRARLGEWNPVDPYALPSLVRAASPSHRTLLIHACEPEGDSPLVGKVNVTSIVRGRALSGTLGYDAFDPYAGRGLFSEGLRLVVDLAFAPEPGGMALHRLEANVQPGNVRSASVLRGLGFRYEGHSPAYLLMPDRPGRDAWRDHDRYAVTAPEWPATAYAAPHPSGPASPTRLVVLVRAKPGPDRTAVVDALAAELGLPVLDAASAHLVRRSPVGALIEGPADHRDDEIERMLQAAGVALAELRVVDAAGVSADDRGAVVRLALRLRAGHG